MVSREFYNVEESLIDSVFSGFGFGVNMGVSDVFSSARIERRITASGV